MGLNFNMKQLKAYKLDDDIGMATRRCSTLEQAEEAFIEFLATWDEGEKWQERLKAFDKNKIKKDTHYFCQTCNYYTIGEAMCYECGKDFKSNGRSTFVYYWHE